jgi:chemotaxis protein CheD
MLEVECAIPEIYLQPGEVYLALQPTVIRTLLGSCVGVTFWSARLGAGALCHALLPRCPTNVAGGLSLAAGRRYADFAIRDLAGQFDKLGALRSEIQVKLFGGADVLPTRADGSLHPTVGRQNCDAAAKILQAEGFQVLASSLGGSFGRTIQFYTGTGEVRLRWLARLGFEGDLNCQR